MISQAAAAAVSIRRAPLVQTVRPHGARHAAYGPPYAGSAIVHDTACQTLVASWLVLEDPATTAVSRHPVMLHQQRSLKPNSLPGPVGAHSAAG